MTITPMIPGVPVVPGPVAATDAAGGKVAPAGPGGDGSAAGTFGALISAQLHQLGRPVDQPVDEACCPGVPAATEDDELTSLPVQDVSLLPAETALGVATAAVPVPVPPLPVVDATEGGAPGESGVPTSTSAGRAEQAPGAHAPLPGHSGGTQPTGLPGHGEVTGHTGHTGLAEPALSGGQVEAGTSRQASVDPAAAAAAAPLAQPVEPGMPTLQQQASPATTVPTIGAAPPVATIETSAPVAAPANPVLDQVTPVLTRLVSGPEGQHRMTLRLHPADLGEIHLTVTVRGDSVDVTVSATPEARELLADGSSQLRALLDSVGRTADRLVFRDLPGTGTAVSTGAAGGPHPDGQAASYGDAAGRHGDGQPGEHGRSTAPGRTDRADAGGTGEARTPTTNPTRTATGLVRGGLDVRM